MLFLRHTSSVLRLVCVERIVDLRRVLGHMVLLWLVRVATISHFCFVVVLVLVISVALVHRSRL